MELINESPLRDTSNIIQRVQTPSKLYGEPSVSHFVEPCKASRKLTFIFSKSEKENAYSVKRKYPSLTPEKPIPKPLNTAVSPDLFDDDAIEIRPSCFEVQPSAEVKQIEKLGEKLDQKLLKQASKSVSGVLPPPSLTVIHMSVGDILNKLEENKTFWFWNEQENVQTEDSLNSNGENKSLLLSTSLEVVKKLEWPHVLDARCHGLHYNCGKVSEEIVDLCDKYQKRSVTAETQSSCTVFEEQSCQSSPSKRKLVKSRWGGTKSPGRRLSHLARRRITFSNASLQAGGLSLVGSRARQILVDAKKMDLLNKRKSPRRSPRKTPNRSPKLKTRTPSSSAKKKLAMRFRKLAGELENSGHLSSESPNSSRDSTSSLFAPEKPQLRRALFASPRKISPIKNKSPFKQFNFEKKRKRSESDDAQPTKFFRSMSMHVKPVSSSDKLNFVSRSQSELNISVNKNQQFELNDQIKKKLLWAVSAALQSQNITHTDPQWKVFASVLARVTRRFFASQINAKGGVTEKLQRIARYHVISVIKGKSVDEIVNEYLRNKAKVYRPQGYVPPDDVKPRSGIKENVFQDRANTMESWEKKRQEVTYKPVFSENKIDRIRKVINFGE
ncbi:hypothetical protein ABEB36_015376 [Hypothenemus hampei]|uniref:Uncharacterized protein n=1 Tax=Hypothenemus hampei TaxID=57062 RepID=A0ABD1E0Y2_HYPHA